jgi:hypothetical protein
VFAALTILVSIARLARVMKPTSGRSKVMSKSRRGQVWFGTLGIVLGAALLLSGVVTSEKAQAANEGISITIVRAIPGN